MYVEAEEIIWKNKKNGSKLGIHKTLAKEWSGGIDKGNGFNQIPSHPKYYCIVTLAVGEDEE